MISKMMDNYVELLFSFDLIRFLMNENDLRWLSNEIASLYRGKVSTTFIPSIGQASYQLSFEKSIFSRKQLVKLIRSEAIPGEYFEDLCKYAVCMCFRDGFCMLDFLKYCSYISAVTVEYFRNGAKETPDQAIAVIAECLKNNEESFISEGSWTSLYTESAKVLKRCAVSKKSCLFCWQ